MMKQKGKSLKRASDAKDNTAGSKIPKLQTPKVDIPPVEREAGISGKVHYDEKTGSVYSVVLNQTDIAKNNNKYYKIQLIKGGDDDFYVFRSWGRVGYSGQHSLNSFPSEEAGVKEFAKGYRDKTKNVWNSSEPFKKFPGKYHVVEMDVKAVNDVVEVAQKSMVSSKLDTKLQELLKMIFDIDLMKQTMLDFDLDTQKLPLGKISKKQLLDAYQVLTDLGNLINRGFDENDEQLVEACNSFYTLMPHSFGMTRAPIISTRQQIEQKRDMIDNLIQIEVACEMMKTEDGAEQKVKQVNILDSRYEAMKVKMEPLESDSEEFEMIKTYMKNTHASTHDSYDLELEQVFKVDRDGESDRYQPFKKFKNRQLLWHGSRKTNFVGILSNGLKIAPKEAPVTGYMFGKGIYFADMVSKSANYCCTNKNNPTGLMLLSEVALGTTHELTQAEYIEKLPKGKHSVKGLGMTQPNPKEFKTLKDGTVVPMGKPTKSKVDSSLLYNEFIVYDTAQVNLQYLLKVKFNYKR